MATGVFPLIMIAAQILLTIWALIDIMGRKLDNKALWIVVILGVPVIGALGYLIGGRPRAK